MISVSDGNLVIDVVRIKARNEKHRVNVFAKVQEATDTNRPRTQELALVLIG